jgi:hypothetical protein
MHPTLPHEDGLEGSEYLSLVIEWNDQDETLITDELVTALDPDDIEYLDDDAPARSHRMLAGVLGALAALGVAIWGIRRLRAA